MQTFTSLNNSLLFSFILSFHSSQTPLDVRDEFEMGGGGVFQREICDHRRLVLDCSKCNTGQCRNFLIFPLAVGDAIGAIFSFESYGPGSLVCNQNGNQNGEVGGIEKKT